jgi:hypothetical protein
MPNSNTHKAAHQNQQTSSNRIPVCDWESRKSQTKQQNKQNKKHITQHTTRTISSLYVVRVVGVVAGGIVIDGGFVVGCG